MVTRIAGGYVAIAVAAGISHIGNILIAYAEFCLIVATDK
jgi:hypothetical protein